MMTRIFNMYIYRSPPLDEYPNTRFQVPYGRKPGKKIRKKPAKTSTPARTPHPPTTQPSNPPSAPIS